MWLNELRLRILGRPRKSKPAMPRRKLKPRLTVEALENRLVPTTFNPATTAALITDIIAANTNGQSANTINLTGAGPYVLTGVQNTTTNGPNGLPVIGSKVASTLTINGNGNTIERNSQMSFRFFEVAAGSGGSLVLKNIALQFGSEVGAGATAEGGAIFNNGTLNIDGNVQLKNNLAAGIGEDNGAEGGAIFSAAGSTLKLNGSNFFEGDVVSGSNSPVSLTGGSAEGGAIFDNATTATALSSTAGTIIEGCQALGGNAGVGNPSGQGGAGGFASGAGLYVNASNSTAKVVLTGFTFDFNGAVGGNGGAGGSGKQGGAGGAGGQASGGAIAMVGGTLSESGSLLVEHTEAVGGAGGAGGSGNFTGGGNGGNGGNGTGGAIATTGTIVSINASPTIESNVAAGGAGGAGGAAIGSATTGGNGGNSGTGMGGGLYGVSGALTLKNAFLSSNNAQSDRPGNGGKGFAPDGGAGGSSGGGFGGGVYVNEKASLNSDTFDANQARAGFSTPTQPSNAGSGANGGHGGLGGFAGGGGLFVAGGTVTIASCFFHSNTAQGSAGGNTANPAAGLAAPGGAGTGGGVDIQGGTVTISNCQFEDNSAQGGNGGAILNTAKTKVVGGSAGGGAAGGGIYAGGGSIKLTFDVIQNNQADAGFTSGGAGPQSHNDSGGGLYVATGSTVTKDSFTSADLLNNSDSNNDGNANSGSGPAI